MEEMGFLERPGQLARKAPKDLKAKPELLAHKAHKEHKVRQGRKVYRVSKAQLERLAHKGLPDRKERLVLQLSFSKLQLAMRLSVQEEEEPSSLRGSLFPTLAMVRAAPHQAAHPR